MADLVPTEETQRGPGSWSRYLLVSVPLQVSVFASLVLGLFLLVGRVELGLVGGPVGAALWTAWANRPGGLADVERAPSRRGDLTVLWWVWGVVALDAVVVLGLLGWQRLPAWAVWVAGLLLLVHLLLAGRLSVRVARRRRDPAAGHDAARPRREVGLRWRDQLEPLRSVQAPVLLCTGLFFAVAVASEVTGEVDQPWTAPLGLAWGASIVLLGLCVALDVRGAGRTVTLQVQANRRATRRPILGEHLETWLVRVRLGGLAIAAAGAVLAASSGR